MLGDITKRSLCPSRKAMEALSNAWSIAREHIHLLDSQHYWTGSSLTRDKRSRHDTSQNAARRRLFALLGHVQVPYRHGHLQLLHSTYGGQRCQGSDSWARAPRARESKSESAARHQHGVARCGVAAAARVHLLVEHSIHQLLRAFAVRAVDDPVRLLGRHGYSTVQILCTGVQHQSR